MTGLRERTKAANRAALVRAALEAFGELGYEAVAVRDIVRRTDLASGTFYNYFADKDAVFAAVVEETAAAARARVRAARSGASDLPGLVERGFRAWFEWIAEDRPTSAFLRRNLHAGVEQALPHGIAELEVDLARIGFPPGERAQAAAAMVAVAVELGARDDLDVEAATRFATRLFVSGLSCGPLSR